ncbi:MAG: hypothetical protein ACOCYV_01850 [Planctomycetota bacterium]
MPAATQATPLRTAPLLAGACVMAGPGALWSLAPLAIDHGGGAFLIAWLICLALLALPLLWLEAGLGLCFRTGIPDCIRRSRRRWGWSGWWSTAAGLALFVCAGLLLILLLASQLAAAIGTQPAASRCCEPPGPVPMALAAAIVVPLLVLFTRRDDPERWAPRLVVLCLSLIVATLALIAPLPGARFGLALYASPDWSALAAWQTWLAAAGGAVFAGGLGVGCHAHLASRQPRTHDTATHALLTLIAGALFQLLLGAAAAMVLGHGAANTTTVVGPARGTPSPPLHLYASALTDGRAFTARLCFACAAALPLAIGAWVLLRALVQAATDHAGLGPLRARQGLLACATLLGALALGLPDATGLAAFLDGTQHLILLPATATLALVAAGALGLAGIRGHLVAHAAIAPARWWPLLLRSLVPGLLILALMAGAARQLGNPALGSTALLVAGVAPALAALAVALVLCFGRRRQR